MVQPMYMQPSMMPRNQQPPMTRPGTYAPPWMFGQGYGGAPPQMQLQSQVAPPSPGAFAVGPPPPSATVAGVIGQNSEQLMRMAAERRDREAREQQRRQMEEARSKNEASSTGAALGMAAGTAASLAFPAAAPLIMPLATMAGEQTARLATDQGLGFEQAMPHISSAVRSAPGVNRTQDALAREEAYNDFVTGLSDQDLNDWVSMPSHVANQMQRTGNFSLFDRYRTGAG